MIYNGVEVFTSEVLGPIGFFYGGMNPTFSNVITRINYDGYMQSTESYGGSARVYLAGSKVGNNAVFYGASTSSNTVTYFSIGTGITETSAGTGRGYFSGASTTNCGIYFGGYLSGYVMTNKVTRLTQTGALYGSETTIGTANILTIGCGSADGISGIFYGGKDTNGALTTIRTINSSGTQSSIVSFSSNDALVDGAGALANTRALFYGGKDYNNNDTDKLVGIEGNNISALYTTSKGTARFNLAGASAGNNAVFYGGTESIYLQYLNMTTVINSNMGLVKVESSLGTGRRGLAGAGSF